MMDGVPGVTQQPIGVGKSFTYSFRAIPAGGGTGGTFFYHSHFDEDRRRSFSYFERSGTRNRRTVRYALHDAHVADLIDQAVFHREHLRLGIRGGREQAS